jgi:hypothetical protein
MGHWTLDIECRMFEANFEPLSPSNFIFCLDSLCPTPAVRMLRMKDPMMTTNNATNKQLELGFSGKQAPVFSRRRETRVERAQWWFAKMRATVASAMDWQAQAEPRPEQIWMPGANREVKI